ncbi:hypothetical protein GGQ74_001129 [Desulfobaculum xiamenense]|uniref:Uncharacterized protein n=1 Tax=Desulfobaculum xiamenense TaxID=995050 RepID=A0A846QS51_9BACT|nr:hypothetical protein [Desulfobaculum xiamenense]NJB67489.1 hypothetical protein [Desulfobaculum xiamenense]
MTVTIIDVRQRPDGDRLHVEFSINGHVWRCGDVPAELADDEVAIVAHLESRSAEFERDIRAGEGVGSQETLM